MLITAKAIAATKRVVIAGGIFVMLTSVANAQGDTEYDFSYTHKGDGLALPAQVFDGNTETFFQFDKKNANPSIVAIGPCGNRIPLAVQKRGALHVVRGIYQKFVINMDGRIGTVEYGGDKPHGGECQPQSVAAPAVPAIPAAPVVQESTNLVPAAKSLAPNETLVSARGQVTANSGSGSPRYDRASRQAEVVHRALQTIDTSRPQVIGEAGEKEASSVQVAAPAAKECAFRITPEDGKLSQVLERWTQKAGYQLSWEIKGEEPVMSLKADFCDETFLEALESVLSAYQNTTPIRAVIHRKNNAVQIISGAR